MRVAIDLVKEGVADAAVSAGNTGALMAMSRFVLKTLPGIDRPAICSVLPSERGSTYVLDLGANVDCSPEHLLQFGIMGSLLVSALEHKERPTVGSAQYRRRRHQGQRGGQARRRAAAGHRPEFFRQRRRQRHLQGHDRCGGLRRLRRQCHAESRRGPGADDRRCAQGRIFAQHLHQAGGPGGDAGAEILPPALRSASLQRCEPARAQGHRRQEPRLGRSTWLSAARWKERPRRRAQRLPEAIAARMAAVACPRSGIPGTQSAPAPTLCD